MKSHARVRDDGDLNMIHGREMPPRATRTTSGSRIAPTD